MDLRRGARLVVLGGLLIGVVVAATTLVTQLTGGEGRATVTVLDESDTILGVVQVRVADTSVERYRGLSDTDSLGPDEGMLFVHDAEGTHTYVMRDMAFPIDIVFVGADRRITTIHHAEVEKPPLTPYRGRGKWVLEVPYRWSDHHGVAVGDRIVVESAG